MRLLPEFQRVQDAYARLHTQYSAGAISPEQFKSAVEAQMVEHDGAYWVIDADSGQWLRHDGQDWREAQPPMASLPPPPPVPGPRTSQPAAPPLTHTAATATAPPAPAGAKRSNLLVPVLAVAAVAVGVAFYLGRSSSGGGSEEPTLSLGGGGSTGDTRGSRGGAEGDVDPLLSLILQNAVPSTYDGWEPAGKPELRKDKERAVGETGTVILTLRRVGDRSVEIDFMFTVFGNAEDAQREYQELTTFDTSRWSASEKEILVRGLVHPQGMTAQCLGDGERISSCHTMTGRALVFVKLPIGTAREEAIAAARAMVAHVTELQGRPR